MKRILIFLLLSFCFEPALSQYWIQRGGGVSIDEGMDMASDGANNSYTTGYFTTTALFDSTTTISSSGLDDVFICKTNSSGALQWVQKAGGLNIDKALAIDADFAGNSVITGFYYTTANFSGQIISAAGLQDAFVAKYDAAGVLLWVISIGGTGADVGNGVTFDNSGNVIVTGEFSGTCSFGAITLTSQTGSIDVFTAKYDSNGNLVWAKKGSGNYTDRGTEVSTDATGNIYVCGMFSDTITFDVQHNNTVYNAMFLLKYNPAGVEQWFRWMGSGSSVNMGGVSVYNSDVNVTGNFSGTLYFYGLATNPTLTTSNPNAIFVCRFDLSGNLVWSHANGSNNEVTAECIDNSNTGEVIIGGNFKCRLSDFSATYGSGIFCSLGYWDSYVSAIDNSGNLMWARQFGGKQNDFLFGITFLQNNSIAFTGSFEDASFSTIEPANFTAYGSNSDYTFLSGSNSNYCSDLNYGSVVKYISHGNKDILIHADVDLNRQPFDFFKRTGTVCNRPYNPICIVSSLSNAICNDTIVACGIQSLFVDLGIENSLGPDFTYLWNTGSTSDFISVSTAGFYFVTVSSTDGCFSTEDSVYFISNPLPVGPLISDSKGINTNALNTQVIPLCLPDSVILTCTNPGSNTVQWSGFVVGQNPVTVDSGGGMICTLTNQFGCVASNYVQVAAGSVLPAVQPVMICLNDSDQNDTVEFCFGEKFTMFIYDQYSNPGGTTLKCLPFMTLANWVADTNFNFNNLSSCNPYTQNDFIPLYTGNFNVTISSWIIRTNPCDTDSVFCQKTVTVIVHPLPSGTLTITASGPAFLCPGDTAMLIALPDSFNYTWSNGIQNDTIFVNQPGSYGVTVSDTVTSLFGCTGTLSGSASVTLSTYPQPNLSMVPSSGLICPNDSVVIVCSGNGFNSWQGPNGNTGMNDSLIYVNTPGYYYCIQTVAPGCSLVSNTVQVSQYNTPILVAFPGQAICNGIPVTLTVITNSGANIQWLPPLSGSGQDWTVTSAGNYACDVTSCGVLTHLSYPVFYDSAFAKINTPGTTNFCSGDSIQLSGASGMVYYFWQPSGDSTLSIYVTQPGTYTLKVTSTHGCYDSASVAISEIQNSLIPPLVSDTLICAKYSVLLSGISTDSVFWSTSPAYSTSFYTGQQFQTPVLTAPVTYFLFTQSGQCRSAFDSVQVSIDEHCHTVVIPNVFTPNGDGINDYFPGFKGFYKLDLKIYNRWGSVIYESKTNSNGWDGRTKEGRSISDGTYYYLISVEFFDGSKYTKKGFITVVH